MKQIIITLLFVSSVFLSFAQAPQKMTYQSVLRNSSDALIASTAVGMQISILQNSPTGTPVYVETFNPTTNINGLVTLEIGMGAVVSGNFSTIDWSAGPYYVKSETDPNGGSTYTISGTSELASVPYALYAGNSFSGDYNDLTNTPTNVSAFTNDAGYITSPNDGDTDPTNEIQTLSINGQDLTLMNGNTVTLPASPANTLDQAYDQGGAGAGRIITADAGGVEVNTATANETAIKATNTTSGVSLMAVSTGASNAFSPIQSTTTSSNNATSAIIGSTSGAAYGVTGQAESTSTAQSAIYGTNLRTTGGHGVYGIGVNGVVGETNYQDGFGLYGRNYDAIGNNTQNSIGTYGMGYVGVWGDLNVGNNSGIAIYANGDLAASGVKTFSIDHPADPENKYLKHFSIESDEVLNMYRGTIEFDANGEAVIILPDYVELINVNYSYQLTPIGAYAPLYIKEEIADGKFIIAGGTSSMKVSWTVYGERNDPYLVQNPEKRNVEPVKEEWNQGKYLLPYLYNQPEDKRIVKPLETPAQKALNIQEGN